MGFSLRNTPIKRKLTLFILLTTSFALIFMGSVLITYEVVTFRRSLAANMTVLARIVGSNTTAALAFEDPKNATEVLGALAAERQITAAAIYDDRGEICRTAGGSGRGGLRHNFSGFDEMSSNGSAAGAGAGSIRAPHHW